MPVAVPNVLEIPKSVPANGGAISRWLTKMPTTLKPERPHARASSVMAIGVLSLPRKLRPMRRKQGPSIPEERNNRVEVYRHIDQERQFITLL